MHTTISRAILASTSLFLLTACQTNNSTTPAPAPLASTVLHTEPVVLAEMTCPVTGEVVTCESAVAYFECYPVYCADRASARQFASLEMKQRARLAAEQVLAQKRAFAIRPARSLATRSPPLVRQRSLKVK